MMCSQYSNVLFKTLQIGSFSKRFYTARRALLYVPGSDKKKISKIPNLGVDCAVLDCEDGVALNKKVDARENICLALNECNLGTGEICVRINSIDSEFCQDDIDTVFNNEVLPSTVVIPKVESTDHISWFANKLKSTKLASEQKTLKLILMVESAKSLLDFREICQKTIDLADSTRTKVEGVIFGSDDYCADIGATRTAEATELMYARQRLLTIAKYFRIQAIDLVHINYKDLEGLKLMSEESARIGFTGKQVIHPSQIPIVQSSYSPSKERIEWAEKLIAAFNEQQEQGKGAITFQGSMIDMPLVLQAQNILEMAQKMQK